MALYICSNCGYGSASWLGKCPECQQFNTFVKKQENSKGNTPAKPLQLTSFAKIKSQNKSRIKTGLFEFDRVLGGGIVPGEVILLSGEPGIGKSTLLLQVLKHLKTIYISGEESAEQVKDRADRLKISLTNLLFSSDLEIEGITQGIADLDEKPDVIVIDSIQTIYSKNVDAPPGNVSQLRESTNALVSFAKQNRIAIIIIGHITKGGDVAGPKTLEHLVDAVLSFEGEQVSHFRILRSSKNRFGSADEIGIFEMKQTGLHPVDNPLAFIANEKVQNAVGKAIVGVNEGKRSLFYEIQTLAVPTVLAVPRRVVKGVDYNKVLLLLAVLRKYLNIPLDTFDIYVNVAGGIDIQSPLSDLGIIASLMSSVKNVPIPLQTVFVGEVGLLGEVRKGYAEEKIIQEAKRLKFKKLYYPANVRHIKELRTVIGSV